MTEQPVKPVVHEVSSGLFPRNNGGGSGTHMLYTVEVRYDYPSPKAHGDFIIDREWRTLPLARGFPGVPNQTYSRTAADFGLLTWPAANALRWWAHAEFGLCLQTRLVQHRFEERYSDTVTGYFDVVGGGGSDEKTRMTHAPITPLQTEAAPLSRPVGN